MVRCAAGEVVLPRLRVLLSPSLPVYGIVYNILYNWDSEGTCCSLILEDNPLVDFVGLPDTCQGLYYCNILSGVVRGAIEMVSMKTEITCIRDMLRGDDAYELQVKLLKQIPEEYPYKDDE